MVLTETLLANCGQTAADGDMVSLLLTAYIQELTNANGTIAKLL